MARLKTIAAWVQGFAMSVGGPGLFLIAFLDSSFLSLPEINDLLLIWMVTQHKERMLYYAAMATLGSIAGCLALYAIARKGGEAFLRRRFHERHVDKALSVYQRYGVLAIAVPAILPPPAPFKIFVLLAGVAGLNPVAFIVAVAGGRGFRYLAEAWLAVMYGEQAIDFLREHGTRLSLWLAGTVLILGVLYFVWKRRKGRAAPGDETPRSPGTASPGAD
jgi:membrane protein YqaA with SNARE-associated domain